MPELKIEARIENLDQVLTFIEKNLEAWDCSMKAQMQIAIAVEEIFVNIAHYAYAPAVGTVRIRLENPDNVDMVQITFTDKGIPYDPLAKEDPDVTLSAEERQIGGLGEYSCAVTPQIRQTGNRLSGLAGTAYASLLA